MKDLVLGERASDGDTLTASVVSSMACIEIEQPWSGDTENGFGTSCYFTLQKDQARQLAAWLLEWAQQ